MIIKYIIAILLFSAIILFHELGHFLLAKANGIRVNEFSLGLGRPLSVSQRERQNIPLSCCPLAAPV